MRYAFLICVAVTGFLICVPARADENATGGGTLNSELVNLAGPFDHSAAVGDASNGTGTFSFTGGFTANTFRLSGTLTSINTATFASEADFQISSPEPPPPGLGTSFIVQNPGPGATFTSFDYNIQQSLDANFPSGIDPAGDWTIEFFESFDDGGVNSQSSNVDLEFLELEAVVDVNGVFALGSIGDGDTADSLGELALENLFDLYTVTLTDSGLLDISTDANPGGFTGTNVDTEIAIFDSAGNLLANDDDGGTGTFSALTGLDLAAGDYTIAVGGFNTAFADGFSVTAGASTGDYSLNVSLVTPVPEPATTCVIGLFLCGLALRRR